MAIENNKGSSLLNLLKVAIENDTKLREQYHVGDKFRFIRDRLNALFTHLEENLKEAQETTTEKTSLPLADETLIYVYLFNVQGTIFKTWEKMLNPSVFYEYSINRPIYENQKDVEAIIRSKKNKAQHGYLTIAIKKEDLLPTEGSKDMMGHPLVRVREGSLNTDKLIAFTHGGHEYVWDDENHELKRKD